jgi:basic membrane protein A and related proteins
MSGSRSLCAAIARLLSSRMSSARHSSLIRLGIGRHGTNQDAWAGLEAAKNNGLADQIAYIESVDARDYDKNISYFADRGFDVIITSGVGLQDETLRAADLYPDSVFVGINQPHEESRPNLIAVTFPEDHMGFMAGALAARLTKTGVVAGVCETSGIRLDVALLRGIPRRRKIH